jgi:hypothetical protein
MPVSRVRRAFAGKTIWILFASTKMPNQMELDRFVALSAYALK